MKKSIIILLTSIALFYCKPIEDKHQQATTIKQPKEVVIDKPYSSPALIYSNSAGIFFQTLYRNNFFDLMMSFTSDRTIKQFGRGKILNYYKHNFKFDYNLGKPSNIYNEGDTINLSYTHACIYGTRRKVVIPFCLENDSIKIILYSLTRNSFE